MRSTAKVALGIDVTDTHINMVSLKKDRNRLTVLNAVRMAVPDEMITRGHVVDPAKLAKIVKATRRHSRIRKGHVAVSLPPVATLARIVPLEEDDPQRIAQFVAGEVQQYAALSGRETVSDFRVLSPARHDRMGKILIVASDRQAVSAMTQMCRAAGARVSAVEPAVLACVRALRSTSQAELSADNCLVALLKDGTLTVCVLLAGALTFIRTKAHQLTEPKAETIYAWVADEINAVLRFCGIESGHEPQGWSIAVADEDHDALAEDVEPSLRTAVSCEAVRVTTQAPLPEEAVVGPRAKGPVPITAFGLALKGLGQEQQSPSVNLMPPEGSSAKSAQRAVLVTSISVSLFILVILLGLGVLELMVKRVNQNIVAMKQADLERNERTLGTAATELAFVEQRIGSLSGEYEYLKQMAESHQEVDWAQLLLDLKAAVPERLRVVELSAQDNAEMFIRGTSHSFESVDVFVQMLNRSSCVARASLLQKDRDETLDGLVQYAIKCTLSPKETP